MNDYTYENFLEQVEQAVGQGQHTLVWPEDVAVDLLWVKEACGQKALNEVRKHPDLLPFLLNFVQPEPPEALALLRPLSEKPFLDEIQYLVRWLYQQKTKSDPYQETVRVFYGLFENKPLLLSKGLLHQGLSSYQNEFIQCAVALGRLEEVLKHKHFSSCVREPDGALRWACHKGFVDAIERLLPFASYALLENLLMEMVSTQNTSMIEQLQKSAHFQPHMVEQMITVAAMHDKPNMLGWLFQQHPTAKAPFDSLAWACRHRSEDGIMVMLPFLDVEVVLKDLKAYSAPFAKFFQPIYEAYLDKQSMLSVVDVKQKSLKKKPKL